MASRGGWAQACAAALALSAVSPAFGAPAADLFYQRAVMTAADSDCHLFAADVSAALVASQAQARGAALRSGEDGASLDAAAARASAAAAGAGCASPDIAAAAARVRAAFAGYARLDHMDFPGDLEAWTAVRPADEGALHWRVLQRDRFGWDEMGFGVAGRSEARQLMAVANFADAAQPYGARLVIRDEALTAGPFLDPRQADVNGRIPIADRLPPRAATRVFAAEAMSPAGPDLDAEGRGAWAFRFPEAAMQALAKLDPRESVAVEFLFQGDDAGGGVRTAYVEVGDFAAARAFAELR
jgi:hypothetical protein